MKMTDAMEFFAKSGIMGEVVEKVSFRKSDFFSELVQALNELIENQNNKKTQ